jgi:DNA-directed RNA polymerase specialized sigma24 family protein
MALVLPADQANLELETTVLREGRRLYAIALAILRDASEAEDAVQETMELAWRSWASLRTEGSRAAWLTRICVRHSLRRRRRSFTWGRPAGAVTPANVPPFEPPDIDLDRAFGRLSPRQRAVVALHYGHGYTLDECPVLMTCRPGTARSHLARALTAMRKELQDD